MKRVPPDPLDRTVPPVPQALKAIKVNLEKQVLKVSLVLKVSQVLMAHQVLAGPPVQRVRRDLQVLWGLQVQRDLLAPTGRLVPQENKGHQALWVPKEKQEPRVNPVGMGLRVLLGIQVLLA